jgi:hypothetical protein
VDEGLIRQLQGALAEGNFGEVYRLASEDYTERYPQSGELVPSRAAAIAVDAVYPGGLPTVIGDPRFSATSDGFVFETVWDYGAAGRYHVVGVCTVAADRLVATRLYFAAPFEPAAWRSRWVVIEGADATGARPAEGRSGDA